MNNQNNLFGMVPVSDLDCFDAMDCFDSAPEEGNRYIRPKLKPFKESRIIYEHAVELAEAIEIDTGVRYDAVVSGNLHFR